MAVIPDSRLLLETSSFLAAAVQHPHIGGSRRTGAGERRENVDPATGRVTSVVASPTIEEVDFAVTAARRAFPAWSRTPPATRSLLLYRLADLVERHGEMFAQLETLDTGKAIRESRADVNRAVDGLRFYAGCARQLRGETLAVDESWAVSTLRKPLGVVAAIVPWNVPLVLTICKTAPALAAGNTVVVKPSEQTPLTALALADLAGEAGLPPGALNVVPGSGRTIGMFLVEHAGVDKVTFTGSTRTGIAIARAAAASVKGVALELGGKSPNLVFADADLDEAARGAADAIFYGQGQICTAGSRLLVERSVYEDLLERVAAQAEAFRVGDPLDDETELVSLISEPHLDSVLAAVKRALDEGAELVTGGQRLQAGSLSAGAFMEPTVLANEHQDAFIEQEEVFGPVLVTAAFDTEEEAVARGNASRYGLSAGVWTADRRRARRVVESLEAGVVWVNGYNAFDAAVPFGGVKQSGNTREWSHIAMDTFTQLKTIWDRM